MEMFKRKIRLFFVSYGKLFSFIIGVSFLVIVAVQTLNSLVIEMNNNKYSDEEYQNSIKEKEERIGDIKYISDFINYCNKKNLEEAYAMLSNKCKVEKYNTIDEFKEKYINKVFDISICKQNFKKQDNIYIVTLTHDAIATGRTDSTVETKLRIDGVLERSIYITD